MTLQVILLYVAIFLAALLAVEGLFMFLLDNVAGGRRVNRRMRMLGAGHERGEVYELLRRRKSAAAEAFGPFAAAYRWLDDLVTHAGITMPTQRLMMVMGGLFMAGVLGVLVAGQALVLPASLGGPVPALAAGLVVGVALPLFRLRGIGKARVDRFHHQLPDALDCMVRSLQAGHPINTAMAMVSQEMGDPIGTEFGLAVDEMTYGLELGDALENMNERVPLDEFRYVTVAIRIQHKTGGNLAEILASLSDVIRARFRMYMKVRAISAEGRLSMKVLAALPVVFASFSIILQPAYYGQAMADPIFMPAVGVALTLELLGILVMRRMVNFRV